MAESPVRWIGRAIATACAAHVLLLAAAFTVVDPPSVSGSSGTPPVTSAEAGPIVLAQGAGKVTFD